MPPATRQLDQVPGWGSGTSGVVARVMLLIDVLPLSTLHQLDADAVGRGDIAQQTAAEALLQFDRKFHALRAQFGAEGREVAFIQKAEMIGAEPVMARKAAIRPDRLPGPGSSPGRLPRIRMFMPPSSTKICGAPYAIVSRAIVAPNISTYHSAEACGLSLMMCT